MTKNDEERLQVKCVYDEEMMHIQGVSTSVQQGREYGFAEKIRTTMEVSMWLKEQPATLDSGASGERLYTPFTIYKYENGVCQMYIPGTPGNHPQGAVLNLHPLSEGIKRLLNFAGKAGFIQDAEGVPYTVEKKEETVMDFVSTWEGEEE